MARYVEGFVIRVPKAKLQDYKKMAKTAGKIWMKHGALEYVECLGDDYPNHKFCMYFPKLVKPTADEVIIFSFIVYKSKTDRNRITKLIMTDPDMKCDEKNMPFNPKKMAYAGFSPFVDLRS